MHSPMPTPTSRNTPTSRELGRQAVAKTIVSMQQALEPDRLTILSQRSPTEVEAMQQEVASVIPAGNVVGLVLSGLLRFKERTIPADRARKDIVALLRGLDLLPQALYGTFFVAPAAVLSAYQKLLALAGKDVDSAFPDGLWQFYLEFSMREDSARHANETIGFQQGLARHNIALSPGDALAAWACAAIQLYFQYDRLLENEWHERIMLRLLLEAAEKAGRGRSLAFQQLHKAWTAQRPYRREAGAADYPTYRRQRFDAFCQPRLDLLPAQIREDLLENYAALAATELPAYQQQLTLLATLEPEHYRDARQPLPLWQARLAIIWQGRYYLLPACHVNQRGEPLCFPLQEPSQGGVPLSPNRRGELAHPQHGPVEVNRDGTVWTAGGETCLGRVQPVPFQFVRAWAAAILGQTGSASDPRPGLDEELIQAPRREQARHRGQLRSDQLQELALLKTAPIILNWDEAPAGLPLSEIRRGRRGIGDHALLVLKTDRSTIFDQSHIFFDGIWGLAVSEIFTNEALSWAVYFSQLNPVALAAEGPAALKLAPAALPAPQGRLPNEVGAESVEADLAKMNALRRNLTARDPDSALTVNDLLVLYRTLFDRYYEPSAALRAELEAFAGVDTSPAAREAQRLVSSALNRARETNPILLIPMDATNVDPRLRLYPTTFRNTLIDLWPLFEATWAALAAYRQTRVTEQWSAFLEQRRLLLTRLLHFGRVMQAHKDVARNGQSPGMATLKLLGHLPPSVQNMLDQIPQRIDVLNEVLKGEEVFSNVGQVARESSLTRFISAKDDSDGKSLVWGVMTDRSGQMFISLRDFRPHVGALIRLGRRELAVQIVNDYLTAYVRGLNEFMAQLNDIVVASAEVRS